MQMNPSTLTDRVADVLVQRIADGMYPVGTKLPAGKLLAGEFSVSAAVIREATERLRTKGLVRTRQGAGCTVISQQAQEGFQLVVPDAADRDALRHIYELRYDIEGGAAALAALRATEDDMAHMRHILASLQQNLHIPDAALEWDVSFHRAIAQATHNPHYRELLSYLARQWRQSVQAARQHTLQAERARLDGVGAPLSLQVHHEHERVLEAIEKRDTTLARQRAQAHLHAACRRLGLDTRSFEQ